MNPADTDPVSLPEAMRVAAHCNDPPNDLVTRHDGEPRRWRAALDFIEFGVADAACRDADQYLVVNGNGIIDIREYEGRGVGIEAPNRLQQHRAHRSAPLP